MAKDVDLGERVYAFALAIIRFVKSLPKETVTQELARQLIRAGTSIAANYEEARGAFSRQDFTYKMSICFKESRESNLWLRLIRDSGLVNRNAMEELIRESDELRAIFGTSVKTAKKTKNA